MENLRGLFLAMCLVMGMQVSTGTHVHPHTQAPCPSPEPPPPRPVPTDKKIMELIVWSDVDDVADILSHTNGPQQLAAGFQYPEEERSQFIPKTSERNNDPDVVALKAIAKSALDSGDTYKLARVMWWSIYPFGGSTLQEATALQKELELTLANKTLMRAIFDADPATEFLPDINLKRRLTCDGCSPVNSFVCAHCWAKDVCEKFFWCRK